MSKRFIVDKDFKEYPKLIDSETDCFYHFDDSMENVEIFCERLNELSTDCRQFEEENKQLREKNKQIGFLKRDLFILLNLVKDTPAEHNIDYIKIKERWE